MIEMRNIQKLHAQKKELTAKHFRKTKKSIQKKLEQPREDLKIR